MCVVFITVDYTKFLHMKLHHDVSSTQSMAEIMCCSVDVRKPTLVGEFKILNIKPEVQLF